MNDPSTPLHQALAAAEAAQAADALADGLAAAQQAWDLAADAEPALRLRAGRLLLHFNYRSGALGALVDTGLAVLPLMRAAASPGPELIDTLRTVVIGAADVGRFDTGLALGQEGLRLAEAAHDRSRVAMALTGLGAVYERLGDPWHAERLLEEALTIARAIPDSRAEFIALNNMVATQVSCFYLLLGGPGSAEQQAVLQRAEPYALQALALAQAMGDDFFNAFARGNYGELLVHMGRSDDARRELQAAQDVAQRRGFDAQAWRIGVSRGELLLREGRPEAALAELAQVLQASAAANARMTHLRLHHAAWRAARAMQQPQWALHHLEQYQQLEHERMLTRLRGHSRVFLTQVEAEQVRLEARRAAERAAKAEVDARVDMLTGLGNRRELDHRWPPLVQAMAAAGQPLALAMLDLDHFKTVNDRFGHAVGDAVLVSFARLLRETLRSVDLVIRTGGEEFLLLLPDADLVSGQEACERLRQAVAGHGWELLAPGLQVSVSAGVVSARPPCELRTLIDGADAALYRAKHGGRNRVAAG